MPDNEFITKVEFAPVFIFWEESALEQIEVDVVKSLRTIEELKVNLLQAQWLFQHGTVSGAENEMVQGLADMVALSYLVSKRLGFDFSRLDRTLIKRLEEWRAQDMAGLESQWGDLSLLYSYLAPED
ncbi:MazG-like family protein [Paradesulfitobacterium aromaticivorans]